MIKRHNESDSRYRLYIHAHTSLRNIYGESNRTRERISRELTIVKWALITAHKTTNNNSNKTNTARIFKKKEKIKRSSVGNCYSQHTKKIRKKVKQRHKNKITILLPPGGRYSLLGFYCEFLRVLTARALYTILTFSHCHCRCCMCAHHIVFHWEYSRGYKI